MYQLFIGNKNYSSWSLRPWVLMRELAIPFEERMTPFGEGSMREAFRRFSPNGRVPCLHDGATVVWDSLAIAEYLAERHGYTHSVETLRRWMIGAELWQPKRTAQRRLYQLRERRRCVGELVQIDGSPHA